MRSFSRLPRRTFLIAALSLPAAASFAQTPPADPAGPIAELLDALHKVMLGGPKVPFRARYDTLAPVIEQVFNLPLILRTSIGLRWTELSAEKQADLLDVFRRYTIASYVANFYDATDTTMELLAGRRESGTDRVVETQLVAKGGTPVRIDYVMRMDGDNWRVVDVLLNGSISRVAVQRSDFRTLVGAGDGSALITSLRDKVSALSGGALQT